MLVKCLRKYIKNIGWYVYRWNEIQKVLDEIGYEQFRDKKK